MKPFQKLSYEGYEVLLFPLQSLYISQGEETSGGSHDGLWTIDYNEYVDGRRIYDAPMYAPCTLKCVKLVSSSSYGVYGSYWQSLNPVWYADGTLDYVSFRILHSETTFPVGTVKSQGEVFNYTGNAGFSTGDHTHIEMAKGLTTTMVKPSGADYSQLSPPYHQYNGFNVNDTVLLRDYGYSWKSWNKPIPPDPPKPLPKGNNIIIRFANAGVNNLWGVKK